MTTEIKAAHTPGKVRICEPITTERGRAWGINGLATPDGFNGASDCRLAEVFSIEANAARFVACWNACTGLNPEAVPDLLRACQAFVEQVVKLKGFPNLTQPYAGALILAEAAIARAKG